VGVQSALAARRVRSASTASGTSVAVANGLHCEFCSSWVVLSQFSRPWRWLPPAPPVVAVGVAGLAGLAAGGGGAGRAGSGIPYLASPARLCQAQASPMRPAFIRTLNRAFLPAIARFRGLPLPGLRALSVGPPESGLVREGARERAGEREDKGGKG